VKRKPATVAPGWDSKAGIRHKESRDAFEFVQKPLGNSTAGFSPVKARCLTKVALGSRVERKGHNSSAFSLAMTSGPETGAAAPLSISASRLAAS